MRHTTMSYIGLSSSFCGRGYSRSEIHEAVLCCIVNDGNLLTGCIDVPNLKV